MSPRSRIPPAKHRRPIDLSPSAFLATHATDIVSNANGPIIDVGAGYGRNALCLARQGADVLCLDNDEEALSYVASLSGGPSGTSITGRIRTRQFDLERDPWPFDENSLGGVLLVHYFHPTVFAYAAISVGPGGFLLFESIRANGGNYVQLPPPGFVRSVLSNRFDLCRFDEKPVNVNGHVAATVKVLARRRTS